LFSNVETWWCCFLFFLCFFSFPPSLPSFILVLQGFELRSWPLLGKHCIT
jgi:hypothetical protein